MEILIPSHRHEERQPRRLSSLGKKCNPLISTPTENHEFRPFTPKNRDLVFLHRDLFAQKISGGVRKNFFQIFFSKFQQQKIGRRLRRPACGTATGSALAGVRGRSPRGKIAICRCFFLAVIVLKSKVCIVLAGFGGEACCTFGSYCTFEWFL